MIKNPRAQFRTATVLMVVSSWGRALVLHLDGQAVRRAVHESPRVADVNREAVGDLIQLSIPLWWIAPVLVVAAYTAILTLGIGFKMAIFLVGILGAPLVISGLLFPSTLWGMALALVFGVSLLYGVYLLIVRSASIRAH